MATKKCIVVIGQSNTDLSGDWRGWIAENRPMNLDIVGPGIGPYGSRYHTMPGTWPGYQTVGIHALTIPELKFLTYYVPSPTGYPSYPGTDRVGLSIAGVLYHLVAWNPIANSLVGASDAQTVTITRKRTGTTHKVTASVVSLDAYGRPNGGAMTVSPPFASPDPELNDEFIYDIRAVENSPSASTVVTSVCWWDSGAQSAAGTAGTLLVLAAGFNPGTETITSVAHGLANGTRLWVEAGGGGGTPVPTTNPAGLLNLNSYVFVVNRTADTFQVSATEGGAAIDITAAPSVAVQFRWFTAPAMARMNGLVLRCTAGTNAGVERVISAVGGAVGQNLTVSVAFPSTPQAGDIFEVRSPTGSFETLAYWLPYCPYVGLSKQWDTFTTTDGAINATSDTITAAGHQMGNGMTITVSSDGSYPSGLAASTTYYVINANIDNGTFQVSTTATGSAIDIGESPAGVTLTWTWNTVGKYNPFPPGFDYYTYCGGQIFHYDGVSTLRQTRWTRTSGFVPSLGYRILDYLGEEVRVLQTSIGGTTLQRQDSARFTLATGVMSSTHIHWSPSDANGIFGLFLARLDRAKAAALEEGHTIDVQCIVFGQGENDAVREEWADRYETNLRTFKAAVRDAIHSRGMTSLEEDRIPWVQPKILEGEPPNIDTAADVWPYAATVNAAIVALCQEDPFMDTCEISDLDHMTDPVEVPGHYSGASYATLSGRIFDAWLRIKKLDDAPTAVSICNMALTHLGDAAKVTSISPPDGSTQATLCARYYPTALSALLQRHHWSFITKRKALTLVDDTTIEDATVDQWAYAYEHPRDAAAIIAVHAPDAASDFGAVVQSDGVTNVVGDYVPQDYVVEVNSRGKQVIRTNVEDAVVRYSIDTTRTIEFPETFVHALSWNLASMLAGPIIKGEEGRAEAKRCLQMLEHLLAQAEEADSKQRKTRVRPSVPWLSGR